MRLIDADKAREEATIDLVVHLLDRQPTIEAKPVVHAHWEHETWAGDFCSNCGKPAIEGRYAYQVHTDYCPSCGAQMDESISCSHEAVKEMEK